ncbi:hypothetical protein GIB67_037136 [Kingdonia uniflora]|nr:hypothetical protein GIB67_037136 [Kingdonia uniflora]
MNSALQMKLAWEVMTMRDLLEAFTRAKFYTKTGEMIHYYKRSTIWYGVKKAITDMKDQIDWIVRNGERVDLWRTIGSQLTRLKTSYRL